jgi:tetratricopeptide (TPR) repeat protein
MAYYIHSLGMMLSLVLSVFFLIWLYSKDVRKRFVFLLASVLAFICILQVPSVNNQFLHHISSDIRPLIWRGVGRMILTHPWLGYGPGNFQIFYPEYRLQEYFTHPLSVDNTDHAHCEALEIAAETGIIGFAVFFIFLCTVFLKVLKNFKNLDISQQYLAGSLLMGAALLLFENLFDVNLRHTSSKFMLWSFLGLAVGLGGGEKSGHVEIYSPSYAKLISTAAVFITVFYFCFIRLFCADILFKQGIQARNENNYDAAIRWYRQAVRLDPYHIEARYRLAFLYGLSGYIERGVDEYTNVIKLAPYFASVHNNLAILYSKKDDLKLSEYHYRIQARLNPYNPETLCGLASVLLRQNKMEEAVLFLRKALILKPRHPFATQALKELKSSSKTS